MHNTFLLFESGRQHPVVVVSNPMKVHAKHEHFPKGFGHGYLPEDATLIERTRKLIREYEEGELVATWRSASNRREYQLVCFYVK